MVEFSKQVKMHWLQDPNHTNVDNLYNQKNEYLKAKIDEPETNSKIKNIRDLHRGIIDFKKGYQPGTNIVKSDKDDMVTDCHSILARWRNHFSQLMNVHGVNDVRQTEIHREPLVPEIEMAIEKLERHITRCWSPAEWIKAGGRTIRSEIIKH